MPSILNERQVGFDTTIVGFPDIGDCMGLVVQVAGGLFGFHIMPREADKVGAFLSFFDHHVNTGAMTHLHGCCRWTKRYGTAATRLDWEAEMTTIAGMLGYHGGVSGFNAAERTKLVAGEAAYLEVRRAGTNTATYHFKRSSKMAYAKTYADSTSTDLRGIIPDKGVPGSFQLTPKLAFGNTSSALVMQTKSNKGEIHAVKPTRVVTFNVP